MTGHGFVVEERHDGGVLVVRLNRPPAHAFVPELLEDIDGTLERAEADDTVRSVVLTGTGDFFSGGFDMKAPPRSAAAGVEMGRVYQSAHRRLVALPKPTVAAVNGHAVAGGLILALACDHRVAVDRRFRVGLTEVAVGAGYPPAASAIAHDRLGPFALDMVLAADLRWSDDPPVGFLFRSRFAPAAFEQETLAFARTLAGFPAAGYAHAKAALVDGLLRRIDAATDDDRAASLAVWTDPESDAARERLRQALDRDA